MLDPIIVLKDAHLATQRGWARRIIARNEAQKFAAEAPPKRVDNKPVSLSVNHALLTVLSTI